MAAEGFDVSFYGGRRVFVTGHTGFKGSWLCHVLLGAGAEVCGYSLEPPTDPSLFGLSGLDGAEGLRNVEGDVRDRAGLMAAMAGFEPEVVVHMAAQPLVRLSYEQPAATYEVNVMGTVNVLEAARACPSVRSLLNVTTDKVYENREWCWGYRETDPLDGFDPYSNSKSCSELVTHSYARSFFADGRCAVSTARAGNVIGGGDFSPDRVVPDCVRAAAAGEPVVLRNPGSVRPYQHVLEPLVAYLRVAAMQLSDPGAAGWYNIGPDDGGCATTGELVGMFAREWGDGFEWRCEGDGGPHEAGLLKLDCAKARSELGWRPRWDLETAVAKTVEWTKCWLSGGDVRRCMEAQVGEYLEVCDER